MPALAGLSIRGEPRAEVFSPQESLDVVEPAAKPATAAGHKIGERALERVLPEGEIRRLDARNQGVLANNPADQAALPEDEKAGLEAIRLYIDAQSIGRVSDRVYPYTRQVKRDIRVQFPNEKDSKFFNDADRAQSQFRSLYLGTHIASFVLLIWYLATTSKAILAAGAPGTTIPTAYASFLDSLFPKAVAIWVVWPATPLLCFSLLLIIMLLVEGWYAKNHIIKEFGTHVNLHYSNVLHEMAAAERMIGKRQDLSREAEMSANWTKIFIWNVKRLRNMDRYATAVSWKMRTSTRNTRGSFQVLTLMAIASVAGAVAATLPSAEAAELIAVQIGGAASFFLTTYVRDNTAWQEVFEKEIQGLARDAPFTGMADCVRGIVVRARSNEYGASKP